MLHTGHEQRIEALEENGQLIYQKFLLCCIQADLAYIITRKYYPLLLIYYF